MGSDLRNLAAAALVATVLANLGGHLAAAGPAQAADRSVEARNYVFDPETVTVQVGDTVTWHFSGEPHTVTSGTDPTDPRLGAAFDSGLVEPGGTFRVTFGEPGTYRYICLVHVDAGMAGTVVVRPAATPTATPAATPRPTATPRRTATPRPSPTPPPSPSPSPSPSPTRTASPSPGPSPTPTLGPTMTATPRPSVPPSSPAVPSPSVNPGPADTTTLLNPFVGIAAAIALLAILGAGLTRRRRRRP